MITFVTLLIIPLIISLVAFLLPTDKTQKGYLSKVRKVSWKELCVLIGVSIIVAATSSAIIYYQNVTYTEVWNGLVTKKARVKVSCRHSYPCNCRTECSGSGKSSSCSTVCDTCYEHSHDFDYPVYDSAGHTIDIDTIDRQGVRIPPRWDEVKIGDPTSVNHNYVNYIKATSDSLLRTQGASKKYIVPQYPQTIYDYYKYNRLISVGLAIPDSNKLDYQLAEMNGRLGPIKQCNVIYLIVKNQPMDYFFAVKQSWENANKNDIIINISVDENKNIQWVQTLCMTEHDIFRVKLRDDILDIKTLDMTKIIPITEDDTKRYFKRKPMKDYQYLMASIVPTPTQYIVSIIINAIMCLGLAIFFYRDDTLDK